MHSYEELAVFIPWQVLQCNTLLLSILADHARMLQPHILAVAP